MFRDTTDDISLRLLPAIANRYLQRFPSVDSDGESIPARKCGFEKVNRRVAVGGRTEKRGKIPSGHEPLELPAGELFAFRFSGDIPRL
jgi:hypothetical protein